MAMKLIQKKAPRGALKRWLSEEEETAVRNVFGRKQVRSAQERALAEHVILEMRKSELWLQCSCVAGDTPALNSANLMSETQTLFLSGFGHSHASACPMFRVFKGDEGATRAGTRKTAGSKRLNYRDFLPADESDATIKAPGKPVSAGEDRTRRKRRPRLARLLMTLIEDAGLNTFSPITPLPSQAARTWLDTLAASAGAQEFIRGRRLSEIVRFQPAMGEAAQERLMQELERPDAHWPAGKARVFYQIFMSDQVTREHVTFAWNGGERRFVPERGVSINGESQEGLRPPYWVILAFKRGTEGGLICSEGYAHALFRRNCPVPVDSGLERQTLEGIAEVATWLKGKAGELTLVKPLFDIEVNVEGEKGFVLPDFIIQARMPDGRERSVVIETMGYTDDEYCERKAEQHKGMRTLGPLQTDPPRWPQEVDKRFTNHLYGVMLNVGHEY
ncbi:hypothetical protein J1782_06995 [Rahnella sp. BCC 1045]|uniref:hypothetical protein n=1 Tax=Rahnella sp. BCC 1045 TaxID=2816251 RepID=UPI001C27D9F7|nr:hypothetical protein [Rahnella sp. BCC 1045]MBU9819631.1 hypothetical protein [Rahnella sp. BCC 1045]